MNIYGKKVVIRAMELEDCEIVSEMFENSEIDYYHLIEENDYWSNDINKNLGEDSDNMPLDTLQNERWCA